MKKKTDILSIVIIIVVLLILVGIGVGLWLLIRNEVMLETPGVGTSSGLSQTDLTTLPSGTIQPTQPESSSSTSEPATEPTHTEPMPTQSAPTEPLSTEPAPTAPAPTDPVTVPTEPPAEPVTQPTEPTVCQHTYGDWETLKAPACTAEGEKQRECINCGEVQHGAIEAAGHSYGAWETTKNATCTAKGCKVRSCADCGKEDSRTISATGHAYDDGTVVKEAVSCADTGTVRYTCGNCGSSYEQTIQGSHSFTYHSEHYYWECDNCGKRYEDYFMQNEPEYSDADPNSALATDTITLKEKTYTGKLSTWSDTWFEYRAIIYSCMVGHSESYHYGSGPDYPYEHPICKDCTKEQAEAVRDEFILFLDDFEDVFGWKPDAPTVEYSSYYQGYCLFFDLKEMYSDYCSQMKKLSDERKQEIVEDVTGYLVHEWGLYDGMSVYNASCLISENIWQWAYYDWSLRLHDDIDGFALGSCVCDGYAKMFLAFADYCGIETKMVTGSQNGISHAWNQVTFSDGTVRYIDLTNSTYLRPAEAMKEYKYKW